MTQPGEDLHELDPPLDEIGRDLEAPEADVLEQAQLVGDDDEENYR